MRKIRINFLTNPMLSNLTAGNINFLKILNIASTRSSNSKANENLSTQNTWDRNVHRSIMRNSQNMTTTQMLIS